MATCARKCRVSEEPPPPLQHVCWCQSPLLPVSPRRNALATTLLTHDHDRHKHAPSAPKSRNSPRHSAVAPAGPELASHRQPGAPPGAGLTERILYALTLVHLLVACSAARINARCQGPRSPFLNEFYFYCTYFAESRETSWNQWRMGLTNVVRTPTQ